MCLYAGTVSTCKKVYTGTRFSSSFCVIELGIFLYVVRKKVMYTSRTGRKMCRQLKTAEFVIRDNGTIEASSKREKYNLISVLL